MFSDSTHPVPSYLAHAALPGAPKREIANDLSVEACVGGQAQGFGIKKTWNAVVLGGCAVGFDAADSYSLRLS